MPCTEHCSIDVVMEGGGIKGIALVGALAVLEDRGYRWVNMAGTSAGAIVATLATAGYTAHELRPIIGDLDFTWFMDSSPRWLPPRLRATYNILAHWGIYKGDRFLTWMREMLAAKGVRTFADLKRGLISRGQQYRVRVVASDVTRGKMIVLPEDSAAYGIDPDDLEVALAVRMSMSIPGFFRPVTLYAGWPPGHGQVSSEVFKPRIAVPPGVSPCYIVDGGLLSNFPIRLFDGPGTDERPTFGLRLTSHGRPAVAKYTANNLLSFLLALIGTAIGAADAYYLDTHTFLRTIEIDNLGIAPTRFDLGGAEKQALYDSGAAAARDFLATWDFDEWKRACARGASVGRRDLLRSALESRK
jgi:NTE family protein